VETPQCPTCQSGMLAGSDALCLRCRVTGSRNSRPLPLLERELQARIEAKTATRYRQRRRAAKAARRIAALPPTLFEPNAGRSTGHERFTTTATQGSITIVDLPAAAVLNVRSTAVFAEPAELLINAEPAAPAEPAIKVAPIEPESTTVTARPVREPAPIAPRVRRRRRPVADSAPMDPPAAIEDPPAPATEEPSPPVEPTAALASVSRIGPQGTNPVWKDRVFNSTRRTQQAATWPRPRPPAADRATEPANRWSGAAG